MHPDVDMAFVAAESSAVVVALVVAAAFLPIVGLDATSIMFYMC